jgi:DNA-binding response OmpR family regulator
MKPHALIVDDSLTVRMDLRGVLHEAGFYVTACDSRAAAQKALRTRAYAVVILDILLPDGSGIDLLKEIRSEPELVNLPVIMLSSEAEVKHRIRGLTTGADEYVGKPYDSAYVAKCARALAVGPASSAPDPTHKGKKLLVVDDSPTYLEAVAELLREDGHDVVLARSGEEALNLLSVELVDGIILDLLMPGMSGLETCRRIRSSPAQRHIPVMMLTGRGDQEAKAQGLAAGVDEFVVKSPELELLKVRVRGLLRKKRGEAPDSHGPRDAQPPRSSRISGLWRAQDDVPRESLLHRVVMESGLSSVIGPTTIVRACRRVGIDAKTMSPSDLARALPTIRDTIGLFLTPEETEQRVRAIASLARG